MEKGGEVSLYMYINISTGELAGAGLSWFNVDCSELEKELQDINGIIAFMCTFLLSAFVPFFLPLCMLLEVLRFWNFFFERAIPIEEVVSKVALYSSLC